MAADVSSLVRILSRFKDDRTVVKDSTGPRSTVALMTRDLLGIGGCVGGGGGGDEQSLELDLDVQVPNGWEKRLDLKSGKVYLQQQCNSTSSSSSSHHHHHHHEDQTNQTVPRFQDLNVPPISDKFPAKPLLSLFDDDDDTSLELKLVPSSISRPLPPPLSSFSPNQSLSYLSSVCTLDKVKLALERAEKDTKKRQSPEDDGVYDGTASATVAASQVAAGCPGCLSYVFVAKNNPKCPRCHSFVPLPAMKKPKIDLNISM
ncbi:_F3O9.30 [Arabidopsis thaliana]|uniref:F3O9.30 n=2 Tax=Arabidopsis thaliana TaxID=3702 RepID=Q9SA48_ARATH|nr:filamentous hemagglutinin transporter [Arabidopsis thaliana]AAD34701.1 >F3O9.30 [Arabidopsis thaliana]AAM61074.1 unknown [Arabidopsis thaliana]AAM98168.1 expressed protein [Arabidopsis thaliana]AAP13404.1 At1g16500 [Arabidopsis thaliana]AEE29462.1 filamentous hemagglutinin transporter [Arabidopsis thaliana]|eukprot:NP_563999.1 filamentous hemagglutinin transporter [Arabidopsis thaliana]